MKKLLLLCLPFFATAAFAQATFQMNPDTVNVGVELDNTDIEAHNLMTNLTSTNRSIKWERTIISMEPDTLKTQVCDPVACFAYWIDTHTFTLTADTTIPMIVHLLKDLDQDASAIVQLKITDLADPGNPQYSYYVFNSAASGTNEQLPAANVKLYPNPVVESFTLENADAVSRIRVFSLDGRQVAVFAATSGQTYSLATQPVGAYIVALESKTGKVFQALEVRKN
ncbi:MAG TPA: T9SS type A sorting domain-containing protein [Saprospiraceae bacterium]|nr:T9SS type A sorting domain-containing protein [Saprospiraceae bacterium]